MHRGLAVHLGLLVVSVGVAAQAWLADDAPDEERTVQIWGGSSDDLSKLEYTAEKRKVVLEAAQDASGRYFTGLVEREKPAAHGSPHSPEPPEDAASGERETLRFVAASEADELADALAPLEAVRALGKLDPARDEEFGFGEEAAKLVVTLGGQARELTLGGNAPGGGHSYVRTTAGETFVVAGDLLRDLSSAESRLMQRELHEWDDDEVASVNITTASGNRALVRATDKKSAWASADAPGSKDESATNWMKKLGRLRVSKYVDQESVNASPAFKVTFKSEAGAELGFTEVASHTAEDGELEYLVRSEQTRWWGTVVKSTGEQLVQDSSAIATQQ